MCVSVSMFLCESVYVCECVRVVCANQWDYLCGLTGGIGKYISAHIPMCVCVCQSVCGNTNVLGQLFKIWHAYECVCA